MRSRSVLWTGHLFMLILVINGVSWLVGYIRSLSELNLIFALAAMAGLILNHVRWWTVGKEIADQEILRKIDRLVIGNYFVLVLVLQVFRFHR